MHSFSPQEEPKHLGVCARAEEIALMRGAREASGGHSRCVGKSESQCGLKPQPEEEGGRRESGRGLGGRGLSGRAGPSGWAGPGGWAGPSNHQNQRRRGRRQRIATLGSGDMECLMVLRQARVADAFCNLHGTPTLQRGKQSS